MEHESALPKDFRFDEYEIVRVLGAGGFGITYLGYDHNLDKPVAIKEYLPNDLALRKGNTSVVAKSSVDQGDFAWGMERFLAEARALAQFDHPNIPKVHRFFETHGTGYIVMEYVEGETLSAHYKKHGSLPQEELKKIVLPLLEGLETIHATGYLHRDIKPANIVLRDDGSPVLIDFGSARAAIGAKSRSITSIITPGYAPIEQYATKSNQGPWTDIYALGAVLYRGVSGKTPDEAANRILNDELQPLAAAGTSSGDDPFLSAIDWALQLRDKDRPQNCKQWRNRLVAENGGLGLAKRDDSSDIQTSDTQASDVQAKVAQWQENGSGLASVSRPAVVAVVGAIILGAALLLWPVFTAPSYNEEQWQLVVEANTPESYRQYIADDGPYSASAKEKLNRLERDYWRKATERNTAAAYQEHLRLFPDGAFANLAKTKAQQAEVEPKAQQEEHRQLPGEMVAISGGSFRMGDLSGSGDDREKPVHSVRIAPFQMGVHEVTVGQFRAFIEDSGYEAGNRCWTIEEDEVKERSGRNWRSPSFVQADSHPVVCVSYTDAQAFIRWLNQKTDGNYRLPTEAEWEYAARAGSETKYHFGNREADLCAYANGADSNSGLSWSYACSDGYEYTAPVGSFKPNQLGLYDMHGNAWEWVQDWFADDYYANSPSSDPQGPDSGRYRVGRGGGWDYDARYLRSAYRSGGLPGLRGIGIGFRLVRQP